jgi:hypothetical protein
MVNDDERVWQIMVATFAKAAPWRADADPLPWARLVAKQARAIVDAWHRDCDAEHGDDHGPSHQEIASQ